MNLNQIRTQFQQQYSQYYKKYAQAVSGDNKRKFVASLYLILSLFTVSFFGIFAISPTLSTVSNLQKQYDDDKLVDMALEEKLQSLQRLDTAYQQLIPQIQQILLAIPTTPKIPYLTREIENLSKSESLNVLRIDFNTVEVYPAKRINQPLYSFTFNVVVQGTQGHINQFIADITNIDRIISIDNITTNKGDGEIYQLSFVGRAYFYGK